MPDVERNKQTVRAFIDLAFTDRQPAEAAAKYMGSGYIQHNPLVPDGPAAFVTFVSGYLAQFPGLTFELKRIVAEDDLVVAHCLLKSSAEDRGTACMDIFRVEDGKVVEHWDVMQPVPESAVNDNAMV